MDKVLQWIEHSTGLSPGVQHRLALTAAIILVLWLLHQLVMRAVVRRTEDVRLRYQWKKSSSYGSVLLALLLIGRVWFEGFSSVATYFGLLSAGLAIALKDLLINLAGWLFILWRRPFEVGDRIQIGDVAGDVIDLRIFQFTLLEIGNWVHADQSTGRVIHVPNGQVFQLPQASYTKGFQFIWNEIPVLITFESDWQKAKRLFQEIANHHAGGLSAEAEQRIKRAAQKFMIFYSKLTPTVYTQVEDSGVLLTIRYLCEPRRRRGSAEEIWEAVLRELARHDDIDLAYPTQRLILPERRPRAAQPPPGPDVAG